MDFSSANVPISRETWAPRSPPARGPSRDQESNNGDSAPPRSRGGDYEDRAPTSAPPPPMGPRDAYGGGGDRYGGRDAGGYRESGGGPAPYRPRHAPAAVEPNNVLGVFGLSINTRERDLEDEFQRYGDVEKVVIVYDQRSDRSRGFGFITMRSVEDATRCVEKLNGARLQGRAIRVDFSATQKPHNPTPGQYLGEKKPLSYDDAPRGGYDRDRRDRYDDRDRYRDRDAYPRRDREREDPYGGRSRRDDYDRRRSPSPVRRRHSPSGDRDRERRGPTSSSGREYDAVPPAGEAPRY